MEKNKAKVILLTIVLIIVIAGFIFAVFDGTNSGPSAKNSVTQNTGMTTGGAQSTSKFETKSSSGTVSIDLTPQEFDNGLLSVDASFDTHSGDLADYDLQELVRLELGSKLIAPSTVPSLSWHHGSGTFVFNTGGTEQDQFKIVIKGIPDIEERVFEWT